MAALTPSPLLKRLLQNGNLAVAGGVDVKLSSGFQGVGIEQDYGIILSVLLGNAKIRTKLVVGSLRGPQAMLAGQGERTRLAVDGGDFPEGGATVHEGVIIHNRSDDRRVMQDDGSVGSGNKLGVGGSAC